MMFCGLNNSSLLYYHDTKCTSKVENHLFIKNVEVYNNTGNSKLIMFYINFASLSFKNNLSGEQKRSFTFSEIANLRITPT